MIAETVTREATAVTRRSLVLPTLALAVVTFAPAVAAAHDLRSTVKVEAAVIRGVSRFRDPGRGQGLAGVRRYIGRWDGKVSVRSGTAKIAIVPSWDDDVPLAEKLAPFPGSQVQVTIPERVSGTPR